MKTITTLLIFSFIASGCSNEPRLEPVRGHLSVPQSPDDLLFPSPVRRVEIEHGGCNGTCPVYTVSIDNSGRYDYEGRRFVREVGQFSGALGPAEARALFSWLRDHPELYAPGHEPSPRSPHGVLYRFMMKDGTSVELRTDGRVGGELWVLSQLVDSLVSDARWFDERSRNSRDGRPAP